jgi:hypothetical protein
MNAHTLVKGLRFEESGRNTRDISEVDHPIIHSILRWRSEIRQRQTRNLHLPN